MMATAVVRSWRSIKPHVPLIKFRKGQTAGHDASKTASKATVSGPLIDDLQLPKRYHRQQLSEQEIEYINRGGPE